MICLQQQISSTLDQSLEVLMKKMESCCDFLDIQVVVVFANKFASFELSQRIVAIQQRQKNSVLLSQLKNLKKN